MSSSKLGLSSFQFLVLTCFGNSHFKDCIVGSYAESKERRDGVEAVDTDSVGSDLHAHCGDGTGKRKLQGFQSNLHANGNSWEEYLGPRDTGIFLTPYGHFQLYTPWNLNKIIKCDMRGEKIRGGSRRDWTFRYIHCWSITHHTLKFNVLANFPTSKIMQSCMSTSQFQLYICSRVKNSECLFMRFAFALICVCVKFCRAPTHKLHAPNMRELMSSVIGFPWLHPHN